MAAVLSTTPPEKPSPQKILTALAAERMRRDCELFVRRAWPLVEPKRCVWNWHLSAMLEHLVFVTQGEIRNLAIMIPPRMSKTLTCSVLWPVWHWIQFPQTQFICAGYEKSLVLEAAQASRRLIESGWFQQFYGHEWYLLPDENKKELYRNSKGGYRISTSVGGKTAGFGGDIQCLPAEELVWTESGQLSIGEIVEQKLSIRVLSSDTRTGDLSYQPVTAWHRNPGRDIYEVGFTDGARVRCTADHKLWTLNRGWVRADELETRDVLPSTPSPDETDGLFIDAELAAEGAVARCGSHDGAHLARSEGLGAGAVIPRIERQSVGSSQGFPIGTFSDLVDNFYRDSVALRQGFGCLSTFGDCDSLLVGQARAGMDLVTRKCPVALGIVDVAEAGAVFEVGQAVAGRIAIKMPALPPFGRRATECQQDGLMDEHVDGFPILADVETSVPSSVVRSFEDALLDCVVPVGSEPFFTAYTSQVGDAVQSFNAGYRQPSFFRHIGVAPQTYCLTVKKNHNFFAGWWGVLLKNCADDLNNTKQVESDAVRMSANEWHDNAWRSRMNNPNKSQKVMVAQRTHDSDVMGHVLSMEPHRWVQLALPMEFDPKRVCITYPNKGSGVKPDAKAIFRDPRKVEGELLNPKRFDKDTAQVERDAMSERAWNAQYQQQPEGQGGLILKKHWWKQWVYPEWHPEAGKIRPLPEWIEIIQVYDTAFEEDEEADFSARTTWGIFSHRESIKDPKTGSFRDGRQRICAMLLDWMEERLTFPALVDEVYRSAEEMDPDQVLIEKKASGHSLVQELRRPRRGGRRIPVKAVKLTDGGDLTARVHAASLMLEKGAIFYIPRKWSLRLIEQVAKFAPGDHGDTEASLAIAWQYARRYYDLTLPDDDDEGEIAPFTWKKRRYG